MNEDKHMVVAESSAAITSVFDGRELTTYVFRGRPCMIAQDLGAALGYTDDGFRACLRSWVDEFIDGKDFDVLTGAELREFKGLLEARVKGTLTFASSVTVLYESGFDLVNIKTEKPLGKKLRRHLADEVLPKIRRGETIGAALPADRGGSLECAKLIARIVELMSPAVSQESKDAALAIGLRMLTGQRAAEVLPALPSGMWRRPEEIAKLAGLTPQRIGLTITKLGLRGKEPHCKTIMDKKAGSDVADVACYLYDQDAVDMILKYLSENPPAPAKTKKKKAA